MDIGKQIKALRLHRGVTQEAMAQHFGVTAQAVSKWENSVSTPDISLLPSLSAYFGVSIDELFALSDETRMERIQNMLCDLRFINPADVENERHFLLDKTRQDPASSEAHELLANLELHLAEEHNQRAEEYALAALARQPNSARANAALARAMGGKHVDPRNNTHNALIAHYKACIKQHPDAVNTYVWLLAQLIDDGRLNEAHRYCDLMARYDQTYYLTVHRIKLALAGNDVPSAKAMWEQMAKDHPTNWSVHHWIGDFQMQLGDYAGAKASYTHAIDLLNVPRYTDPVDSLAKVCEMDGDYSGAIAARRLELEIAEKEWGDTTGESVESIRREILRLTALL